MPQVSTPCPKTIQPINYYNVIPINKQLHTKTPHPYLITELSTSLDDIQNIEQDYIDLFSYTKKGHMAKYVHMYRPDIYDNAIKQDVYYPFKMECDLLTQKADQIVKNLKDVTEVIEIGPGSYTPVISKTVPLLRALVRHSSFSTYKTMDSNLEYAQEACQIIKKQFKDIKTEAIEFDFLSKKGFERIKYKMDITDKKLFFAFGQLIFGNNNDEDIRKFMNNIGSLLKKGDYLLFGIDTNQDEGMLKAAYNSKMVHELLLNTMHHLKNELKLKWFNPEGFESIYKWNHEESTIEHCLKPTIKQVLRIRDQEFVMGSNKEFNILNSRKLELRKIEKFLEKEKLIIKEVISSNEQNKFSIIIAQKIEAIVH